MSNTPDEEKVPKPWVYSYLEDAAANSLRTARVCCILMLISMSITILTTMYFWTEKTCP